ncbi:EndoU domain-containing protein [Listeria costaricensis]|uniref:EndoU domain-containing protein n=1 Tax=Listeria costaricensis TaxID=2026604 RepID=UPI001F098CAB|nr:EndoU domain-containing protein [Listeria costaricensis]
MEAYEIYAVVYTGENGKPEVMWILEQNGHAVRNYELTDYLKKTGQYLSKDRYQVLSLDDIEEKVLEGWKEGGYYLSGKKYSGVAGATLKASAYVQDSAEWVQESDFANAVLGLGLSTAAIRSKPVLREQQISVKNNVPDSTLKHADLGDFNANNRLINGGHGESNIKYLQENNIEYNIVTEYPNGVRVGNVPSHKNKMKRSGTGQSWFPESWNDTKIRDAGNYINNLPENKNLVDGKWAFGEYDGVRVGIIKQDGKITTIVPDNSRQP